MKRMLGGVVVLVLALSGCSAEKPDQEIPVFTPTPISAPSPSPKPTPGPADPVSEATAAYERSISELQRLYRAGGADELTPILLETTDDQYRVLVGDILSEIKRRHIRLDGESRTIISDHVTASQNQIVLYVCEDGSAAAWLDAEGKPVDLGFGEYFETMNTLSRREERWVIVDATSTRLSSFAESERCRNVV